MSTRPQTSRRTRRGPERGLGHERTGSCRAAWRVRQCGMAWQEDVDGTGTDFGNACAGLLPALGRHGIEQRRLVRAWRSRWGGRRTGPRAWTLYRRMDACVVFWPRRDKVWINAAMLTGRRAGTSLSAWRGAGSPAVPVAGRCVCGEQESSGQRAAQHCTSQRTRGLRRSRIDTVHACSR